MSQPNNPPAAVPTSDVDEKGNYWADPLVLGVERAEFPVLFATATNEATALAKQTKFHEAVIYYSRALQFQPGNLNLLSSRSHCKYLCGDHDGALADAEAVLAMDANSVKGILNKANALYESGDFEGSLLWYHRGLESNSNMEEFNNGISKCNQAILQAMSEISPERLKSKRKKVVELERAAVQAAQALLTSGGGGGNGVGISPTKQQASTKRGSKMTNANNKDATNTLSGVSTSRHASAEAMERHLLDELYEDRQFLQSLANDSVFMHAGEGRVGELVQDGITYLDSRMEFWRAKNPTAASIQSPM